MEHLLWPKLTKLTLSMGRQSVSYQTLRMFDCPELTRLEVNQFKTEESDIQSVQRFNHGDAFRHLTVLKVSHRFSSHSMSTNCFIFMIVFVLVFNSLQFGCYNSDVEKFLSGFNENVCSQITEISLRSIVFDEKIEGKLASQIIHEIGQHSYPFSKFNYIETSYA